MEPILQGDNERYVVFPIKYSDLWELYLTHMKAFWMHDEIDYEADVDDWEKLSDDERYFIEYILAFFAGSDGIVMENLVENFCSEVKIAEARSFYTFQAAMESVHATTYGLLLKTFVKDPIKQHKLFNAIDTIPVISKKAEWAKKWMNPKLDFGTRLIAFAIVEGVFFSGAFCAIFWLKDKGKMVKALGHSNELISRDEGLHTEFAVTLFKHLKNTPSSIYEMMTNAVNLEKEFITEAIPCKLIGMNAEFMKTYIEFVADRLCAQLNYPKIYNSNNPFDFMERLSLDGKTNFFEKRTSEYTLTGENTIEENAFDNLENEDF